MSRWVPLGDVDPTRLRYDQRIRLVVGEHHPTRPPGPHELTVYAVEQGCEGDPEGLGPFWWMIRADIGGDPRDEALLTMFEEDGQTLFVLTDGMIDVSDIQLLRPPVFTLRDAFGDSGLLRPEAGGIRVRLTLPCTPGHIRALLGEGVESYWEQVFWADLGGEGVCIYVKQPRIGDERSKIHLGAIVTKVEVEVDDDWQPAE